MWKQDVWKQGAWIVQAALTLAGAALSGAGVYAATPQSQAKTEAKTEAKTAVKITEGERGLQSLRAGPLELLEDGQLRVSRAVLREWDDTEREGDTVPLQTRWERGATQKVSTQTYKWGRVNWSYAAQGERVTLSIVITNTSPSILQGVSLSLLTLRLPPEAKPASSVGEMVPGVDAPGVVMRGWQAGTLALCNEDVGRPLYVGMLPGGDAGSLGLQAATFREDRFPRGWLTTPKIARPIYPGATDHFTLSLRFGPGGASAAQMAGDVLGKFAHAYPLTLAWKDRRPIGTLHLGAVEYREPKNPRGWLEGNGSVDTTTDAGRAALRARLLRYAAQSVAVLKGMDAQGMIVWDSEGNEYPHATTYLGDPRHLPAEAEPVMDAFFKKFTDAGLRVGLCIRPSQPALHLYGGDAWQMQSDDPVFLLNEKIAYARKRWGCSIFYIDSNVIYDPRFKPSDGAGYELLPATVFQRVASANPDALLLPEQKSARYYAYAAPYMEFRQGYAGTPDTVRALYPNSFSAIYVPDGPVAERRSDLVAAVKRGDILLFRAWWPDPVNAEIKSIYAEGRK